MILGPFAVVDCLVYLIFLALHLLLNVGVWGTLWHVIAGIPFLLIEVPTVLIRHIRFSLRLSRGPENSFDRHATVFESLVVRCARYANANLPPDVLQAFFHKNVVYPVLRFRMLRHLYIQSPVNFREHTDTTVSPPVKGIWIREDDTKDHDIVLYYIHGGGFVMGSTHFYLEYLMAVQSLLLQYFHNPAIFAVEYSLAPGAQYPQQSVEVLNGYCHALSVAKSGDRVCVMGDSAGGALGLNLLGDLHKVMKSSKEGREAPAFMVAVSPWMTLVSDAHRDTQDDYLSTESLHKFARLYDPENTRPGVEQKASPSVNLRTNWKTLCPSFGYYIWYGDGELLAPDIRSAVQRLRKEGAPVHVEERQGLGRNLHVWPLISFFLASNQERRLQETRHIVGTIGSLFTE